MCCPWVKLYLYSLERGITHITIQHGPDMYQRCQAPAIAAELGPSFPGMERISGERESPAIRDRCNRLIPLQVAVRPEISELTEKYEMHVIPNTHWDREWLYDFQETRMQLVKFMDRLLEMLDQYPEYTFLLDSQVAPLDDYLEVRPEREGEIVERVKEGRITAGPWYTCPEEFNVNGESLVRNLLFGHRAARRYGRVMKIGYSPFSYGKNSQIAQIYGGFGIDTILFYHGVTLDEAPSEFILEGADGTQLLASRMGSNARYNFFFDVYRPAVYGKEILERDYSWKRGDLPFHFCGADRHRQHYFLLDPQKGLDDERLRSGLENLKEKEVEACSTNVLAYMMGHDSYEPDWREVEIVKRAKKLVEPDEIFFSTLEDYVRSLKSAVRDLPVLKGERRTPRMIGRAAFLYHEVTSSRTRIKQASARAENSLQRWAEPFCSVSFLLGEEYPSNLLGAAWRYLFRSHPHDTIAGTGVDQIERDVSYRLDQVRNISAGLTRRALQSIQLSIDNSDLAEDEVAVTVFNPSPFPRTEVVTCYLDLPDECGYEYLSMVDAETREEVDSQVFSRTSDHPVIRNMNDATLEMPSEEVGLHFLARDVPGLGYRTFVVRHDDEQTMPSPSMVTGPRRMENEHMEVSVESDGTLTITHKDSGKTYRGLNFFSDDGEAGHAWRHVPPAFDRVVTSQGSPAKISLVEDGPLVSSFRITVNMEIPVQLDEARSEEIQRLDGNGDRAGRSEMTDTMRISSLVTLRRGARMLEVETDFDNRCRDHRLRVGFPSGVDTGTCHAESPFDVVEREIERGPEGPWIGPWKTCSPQQRFVDVSNQDGGLAILNEGIREYMVSEDQDRVIYLTLLRAYEVALTTVAWRWERHPEMGLSQCPGEHSFRYAIMPHSGDWEEASVVRQAEVLNLPMMAAEAAPHEGRLPKAWGLIEIEGASLSALKRAEEGEDLCLRVYNPGSEDVEARMRFGFPVESCSRTDMEERNASDLEGHGDSLEVELESKRIGTFLVSLEDMKG